MKKLKENFILPKLKCFNCGHEWIPRTNTLPKACPACMHRDWNIQKKKQEEGGEKK